MKSGPNTPSLDIQTTSLRFGFFFGMFFWVQNHRTSGGAWLGCRLGNRNGSFDPTIHWPPRWYTWVPACRRQFFLKDDGFPRGFCRNVEKLNAAGGPKNQLEVEGYI